MSYLDALWTYQQEDQKVDAYEMEIRQNPMRKKLVRLRNFYKEQQDAMKAIEEATARTASGLEQAEAQLGQLDTAVSQRLEGFKEDAFESSAQIRDDLAEINSLIARLSQLKQKVDEMSRQCSKLGGDLKAARVNATKAKNDYAQLKEEYDSEFAIQSQKLDELKARRDAGADAIPKDVLTRYEAIKRRCTPVMAVLDGDKCGGCNMSLPALILSNARKGERMVECETCGRIIYIS